MPAKEARARALDALVPDGATLGELDRLHASHYQRLTRHFSPGRLRTVERSALALTTAAVLLAQTVVLLRADWLRSPSPFLWPVLGLGALLFAAIAAQSFKLWVKHDHQETDRTFRIILLLSGLTLATGIFGALADFFRLAEALEAEPGLAGSLFPEWLAGSCVLLSFSLLLAVRRRAGLVHCSPVARHPGRGALRTAGPPPVRLSRQRTRHHPRGAAGGTGRMIDPAPTHDPESMGELP